MVSVESLQKLELFEDFTKAEIESILACSSEDKYPPDTVILEESGQNDDLYIILKGRVWVEMEIPTIVKKHHVERISVINAEHVFGEVAFIEGTPRSAQIRAIDPLEVIIIDSDKAHKLFKENFELGFKMMRNLAKIVCDRLKSTNFQWRSIVKESMY